MDYVEKRKQGRKRIFKKMLEENDKKERIENNRSHPIAIKNEMITKSIYSNLTLQEKKLYRFILSLIKKDDDINSTFILRHTQLREMFKTKAKTYTSKVIFDMLHNISSSFSFENGDKYISIPIFKWIETSKDKETTQVIFNEFFNKFLFLAFDKGNFLKYELSNILDYKNLHSPELFELLYSTVRKNQREEIVSISFSIDKLKQYLNCEEYTNHNFLSKVIKKSIEEINKYNERILGGTIQYKYDKTKKTITFYIENIVYMLKQEKKSR